MDDATICSFGSLSLEATNSNGHTYKDADVALNTQTNKFAAKIADSLLPTRDTANSKKGPSKQVSFEPVSPKEYEWFSALVAPSFSAPCIHNANVAIIADMGMILAQAISNSS